MIYKVETDLVVERHGWEKTQAKHANKSQLLSFGIEPLTTQLEGGKWAKWLWKHTLVWRSKTPATKMIWNAPHQQWCLGYNNLTVNESSILHCFWELETKVRVSYRWGKCSDTEVHPQASHCEAHAKHSAKLPREPSLLRRQKSWWNFRACS